MFWKVLAVSGPAVLDTGTQCQAGTVQLIFPFHVHEPGGHLSAACAWCTSWPGAPVVARVARAGPGMYRVGTGRYKGVGRYQTGGTGTGPSLTGYWPA